MLYLKGIYADGVIGISVEEYAELHEFARTGQVDRDMDRAGGIDAQFGRPGAPIVGVCTDIPFDEIAHRPLLLNGQFEVGSSIELAQQGSGFGVLAEEHPAGQVVVVFGGADLDLRTRIAVAAEVR